MIQGNAILVVDLGNSSTKCTVMFGKDPKTGLYRSKRFDLRNVFAPIEEGYQVSADYSTDTSTIIHVETSLNGRDIVGNFCNGELQMKEKPLSVIKPAAMDKKYNLDSTVLSIRLAFLYACKTIMRMQRVYDYSQLDLDWSVVCLLPPGDIEVGKAPLIEIVKNVTEVEGVYPEVTIPIKVSKCAVLPEGMCAYVACVYDRGHVYRPDYKYLQDETVMIFDIGAGTTDCLLIKNDALVQNSKYTVTQGGNNVYQLVRRKLRMNGLDIDEDALKQGIIEGKVKDGTKYVSIVDEVNSAKSEVAQKIIAEFQDFITVTDIKLRSVGYVLVCGGGSIDDGADEISPLSHKVIENFKTLAPNSELIPLPCHMVQKEDEDGVPVSVKEEISPRDLNLLGASILAEVI